MSAYEKKQSTIFQDVKMAAGIHDVVTMHGVDLKPGSGDTYVAHCPFHDDKTPSFTVYPDGRYHCFGCGLSGDAIEFTAKQTGMSMIDAARLLADRFNVPYDGKTGGGGTNVIPFSGSAPGKIQGAKKPGRPKSALVAPIPEKMPNVNQNTVWRLSKILVGKDEYGNNAYTNVTHKHEYKDMEGRTLGYALRAEWMEGGEKKKTFRPLTLRLKDDGSHEWQFITFDQPYPFYGLQLLSAYPDHKVLIVEGEKCADAANELLNPLGWIVLSIHGGAEKHRHMDLAPLQGRDCTCWPDHKDDGETGLRAMRYIAKKLGCKIVNVPEDYPAKWDIGNAISKEDNKGRYVEDVVGFIEAHSSMYKQAKPANDDAPPDAPPMGEGGPPDLINNEHYRLLGFSNIDGIIWLHFYLKNGNTVTNIKSSQISRSTMNVVAPYTFFRGAFPWIDKQMVLYEHLSEEVARLALSVVGRYDPIACNGLGVWDDSGKTVINLGDVIVDNNERIGLADFEGSRSYESAVPKKLKLDNPLSAQEAAKVSQLVTNGLNWERRQHADYLLGWLYLAPLCGVLDWRPHIWLHGEKGTGKTWIMENIVKPMLGPWCNHYKSNITEAGVRQGLLNNALPVLLDEAESNTPRTAENITSIVEFARQASSNTEANIVKGSRGGRPVNFRAQSMFCFSSINPAIKEAADKTRFAMLRLVADKSKDGMSRFLETKKQMKELIGSGFYDRMITRGVRDIEKIKKIIEIFREAVAMKFNDNRVADQYGTLLAGRYAFTFDNIPDKEQVAEFIENKIDWEDEREAFEDTLALQALNVMRQHEIRFHREQMPAVDLQFADVVERAAADSLWLMGNTRDGVSADMCEAELRKFGVIVENNFVYIANTSEKIKNEVFKGKPFAVNYKTIFKGIDGATIYGANGKQRMRSFSAAIGVARFVAIPVEKFIGKEREREESG